MKKLILFPALILVLSGCATKIQTAEVNDDPLNLFNDKPPVTVEGGTENDPLDLFTDEEEKVTQKSKNE